MSRFFSYRNAACLPYVPGEQPRDRRYIKLNTNESPFPPSPAVIAAVQASADGLNLYNDPDFHLLRETAAAFYGITTDEITFGNGSDEILNLAFLAFADDRHPLVFPDLTYGFYKIAAAANGLPWRELPLPEDFAIVPESYPTNGETVVIANPNAPTGLRLSPAELAGMARRNPDGVLIVDEAYIDFGNESCIPLIHELDNLVVVQTFSKSRSLAGARIGFAAANKELIADINTIRSATVPYNVSTMAQKAAIAAYQSDDYYKTCCRETVAVREETTAALRALGFTAADSHTNFILAKTPVIGGGELYAALKTQGILVRHFTNPRISDYIRITVGSREEMKQVLAVITGILEEAQK